MLLVCCHGSNPFCRDVYPSFLNTFDWNVLYELNGSVYLFELLWNFNYLKTIQKMLVYASFFWRWHQEYIITIIQLSSSHVYTIIVFMNNIKNQWGWLEPDANGIIMPLTVIKFSSVIYKDTGVSWDVMRYRIWCNGSVELRYSRDHFILNVNVSWKYWISYSI